MPIRKIKWICDYPFWERAKCQGFKRLNKINNHCCKHYDWTDGLSCYHPDPAKVNRDNKRRTGGEND